MAAVRRPARAARHAASEGESPESSPGTTRDESRPRRTLRVRAPKAADGDTAPRPASPAGGVLSELALRDGDAAKLRTVLQVYVRMRMAFLMY